jgi:hypothetical protein
MSVPGVRRAKAALSSGCKSHPATAPSNKNGVGCRRWTHVDGFSENVIRFMREIEVNE